MYAVLVDDNHKNNEKNEKKKTATPTSSRKKESGDASHSEPRKTSLLATTDFLEVFLTFEGNCSEALNVHFAFR